jgi:hypothetical protein
MASTQTPTASRALLQRFDSVLERTGIAPGLAALEELDLLRSQQLQLGRHFFGQFDGLLVLDARVLGVEGIGRLANYVLGGVRNLHRQR